MIFRNRAVTIIAIICYQKALGSLEHIELRKLIQEKKDFLINTEERKFAVQFSQFDRTIIRILANRFEYFVEQTPNMTLKQQAQKHIADLERALSNK